MAAIKKKFEQAQHNANVEVLVGQFDKLQLVDEPNPDTLICIPVDGTDRALIQESHGASTKSYM